MGNEGGGGPSWLGAGGGTWVGGSWAKWREADWTWQAEADRTWQAEGGGGYWLVGDSTWEAEVPQPYNVFGTRVHQPRDTPYSRNATAAQAATVDNAPSVGAADTIVCGICNDFLDVSVHDGALRLHKMQCGHLFHFYCLDEWAKSKVIPIYKACPYKCHANAEEPIQLED